MIKIEKVSGDTLASITRAGAGKVKVYPNMLLSNVEFDTLDLEYGSITYSIDEMELKTINKVLGNENIKKVKNENNVVLPITNTISAVDFGTVNTVSTTNAPVVDTIQNVELPKKEPVKKPGKTVK